MLRQLASISLLAIASLGSLVAATRGGGATTLPDRVLDGVRGANPNQVGYPANNPCAVGSGGPSYCASPNIGFRCIICNLEPANAYSATPGGTSNVGDPVQGNCNTKGKAGTCAVDAMGNYYCDVPQNFNGRCIAQFTVYPLEPIAIQD